MSESPVMTVWEWSRHRQEQSARFLEDARRIAATISPNRRFIRELCARHGVTLEAVWEDCRFAAMAAKRKAIVREFVAARPNVSIAETARLFRRDHTTILHALGRRQRYSRRKNQHSLEGAENE